MEYEYVDKDTILVYDSKQRSFLISPEDIPLIEKYIWYVANTGYVERKLSCTSSTKRIHNMVLPSEKIVDHINGNKSDNRRINLRVCTTAANMWNSKLPKNNIYGVKGITKRTEPNYRNTGAVRVVITVNKKRINLGTFYDIGEACAARIAAEKKYYNEYRRKYAVEY